MKYTIATFDFDGTITNKNTFLDFILRGCGFKRLFIGGIKSLLVLFLYALRVISADRAKEKIFKSFFSEMSESKFNRLCENYSLKRLPKITKKEALQKIEWHRVQGHKLVIVSASIKNWIEPWAKQQGFDKIITTIPESQGGLLTGKFLTKNCNREEKSRRFLAEYPNRNDYYLYVYGDNHKDDWLFNIADERFYRKF